MTRYFSKKVKQSQPVKHKPGKRTSKRPGYTASSQKKSTAKAANLTKKIKLKRHSQQSFVQLLADLLVNGFTLQESLNFMEKVLVKEKVAIEFIQTKLSQGTLFYQCLQEVGFSERYVGQLYLAETHGDLSGTLIQIGGQLKDQRKQTRELTKVLAYPLLLLAFLFSVMLLMKVLLLPQLSSLEAESNQPSFIFLLIQYGPELIATGVIVMGILVLAVKRYFRRKAAIKLSEYLMIVPLFNRFVRFYYTSFFALEWGKLLNQGLEMKQLLLIMQGPGNTKLMSEVATILASELEKGEAIHVQIKRWSFFEKELSLIIQQGEAKGRLGAELVFYGQRLWQNLNDYAERAIAWLQPIMFVLIALLILAVYSALLLPIYKDMEGLL